jgi:hypothetical protein
MLLLVELRFRRAASMSRPAEPALSGAGLSPFSGAGLEITGASKQI